MNTQAKNPGPLAQHQADLSAISNDTLRWRIYSLLRRLYLTGSSSRLDLQELYQQFRDGGLAMSSLEMMEWLDDLAEQGMVTIRQPAGSAEMIEVARLERTPQ